MSIAEKLQTIAENEQRVYEAGKKAELVALWNTIQDNGNRRQYQYAFSEGTLTWTDDIFLPQHPIICDGTSVYTATALFNGNMGITDTKVPITISNTRADTCFRNCINLKRIPSLTLEKVVRFSQTFEKCRALEELNMYGEVDIDGLDLQWSTKLSKASITSIINALSTTTSGLTVTLSKTAKEAAFTADEWAALIATRTNWTISLV